MIIRCTWEVHFTFSGYKN